MEVLRSSLREKNGALALGFIWDPDIKIHMQLANGNLELSEGLALNVAFLFGEITSKCIAQTIPSSVGTQILRRSIA